MCSECVLVLLDPCKALDTEPDSSLFLHNCVPLYCHTAAPGNGMNLLQAEGCYAEGTATPCCWMKETTQRGAM